MTLAGHGPVTKRTGGGRKNPLRGKSRDRDVTITVNQIGFRDGSKTRKQNDKETKNRLKSWSTISIRHGGV